MQKIILMKKKINLLCALIMILIGASALWQLFAIGQGFGVGFNSANTEATQKMKMEPFPTILSFSPRNNDIPLAAHTVELTDGQQARVLPVAGICFFPDNVFNYNQNTTLIIFNTFLPIIYIVLAIWTMVLFIKLIINVNKDYIFEHRNVKILRKCGWILLAGSLALIIHIGLEYFLTAPLTNIIKNIALSPFKEIPWSPILLALLALLLAEIWNRAILMKEEQELTI